MLWAAGGRAVGRVTLAGSAQLPAVAEKLYRGDPVSFAEGNARFVAVSPDHFFAHGAKEGDIPFFGM